MMVNNCETAIATYGGTFFDYVRPELWDGNLDDIAHGLSNLCRFSGQCKVFYSVGMHSLFVAKLVSEEVSDIPLNEASPLIQAALFHDAHEAFYVDVPSPLKGLLGEQYKELCDRFDKQIAKTLGIDSTLFHHPIVKAADNLALRWEGRHLFSQGIWPEVELPVNIFQYWKKIIQLSNEQVKDDFKFSVEFFINPNNEK